MDAIKGPSVSMILMNSYCSYMIDLVFIEHLGWYHEYWKELPKVEIVIIFQDLQYTVET